MIDGKLIPVIKKIMFFAVNEIKKTSSYKGRDNINEKDDTKVSANKASLVSL